ncbi:MAG: acyl-CoA dehydrogenase family protein [Acidobacteriota bacterium]|nr:acyl-CoA dehydrogenase family protein [Acidobacteriota bacterium]
MPAADSIPDPAVVETARSFVPRVLDAADQIEAERRLPAGLVDAFRDAGLFRLFLPREFGGSAASPFTVIAVAEVLGHADASTAWCVNVANQAAWLASRLSVEAADGLVGPDSILLSSGVPAGKAEPVEGGYRFSGTWGFASGAPHANVFTAVTPAPGGGPATPPIMAFLPASDCRVLDTWQMTGMRGTGSHDFVLDDVFVPAARVVVPGAPQVHPGALYKVPYMRFVGRGGIALGVARKAIDAVAELIATKTQAPVGTRLATQERFQIGLAEAEAAWGSARAWLREVMTVVWEPLVAGEVPPYEDRARLALATAHAAQTGLRVVQDVYRLGGTTSAKTTWVLDRCIRDLLTASADVSIGPGIHAAAGRAMLKEGPPFPLL